MEEKEEQIAHKLRSVDWGQWRFGHARMTFMGMQVIKSRFNTGAQEKQPGSSSRWWSAETNTMLEGNYPSIFTRGLGHRKTGTSQSASGVWSHGTRWGHTGSECRGPRDWAPNHSGAAKRRKSQQRRPEKNSHPTKTEIAASQMLPKVCRKKEKQTWRSIGEGEAAQPPWKRAWRVLETLRL